MWNGLIARVMPRGAPLLPVCTQSASSEPAVAIRHESVGVGSDVGRTGCSLYAGSPGRTPSVRFLPEDHEAVIPPAPYRHCLDFFFLFISSLVCLAP